MTTLATHPPAELNLLDLIAEPATLADAFRVACESEAADHDGWINPNAVRARLLNHPAYEPRQYAALWSASSGPSGWLVKKDRLVQISGAGSRHNGNKAVPFRRLRGDS